MAAPPPYWKKKTRPCPFYSQGRCLFSDACNFVHSVKINPDAPAPRLEDGPLGVVVSNEKVPTGEVWHDAVYEKPAQTVRFMSPRGSLSRTPSEKRRRVVLMSPPRSPRMSGLLSALESVIGPDVEEVEVTDDEDEENASDVDGDKEEGRLNDTGGLEMDLQPVSEASPSTESSSRESISLSYYQGSPAPPSATRQSVMPSGESASPPPLPVTKAGLESDSVVSNSPTSLPYCQDSASPSLERQNGIVDQSSSPPTLPAEKVETETDSPSSEPSHQPSTSLPYCTDRLASPSAERQSNIIADPSASPPNLSSAKIDSESDILESDLSHHSPAQPTSLPYSQNSLPSPSVGHFGSAVDDQSPSKSLPAASAESSTAPLHTPLRSRVPSPIVTQHLDYNDHTTTVLDNNTLEVHSQHHHQHINHTDDPLTPSRGPRRHSTFELLTSPFASPAFRILSPQLFPTSACDPTSPAFSIFRGSDTSSKRPYADDDVDSLETLESSNDESRPSSSTSLSQDSSPTTGANENSISVETCESPSETLESVASPNETERAPSDYSCTPKNQPTISVHAATDHEVESSPPPPTSLTSTVLKDSLHKTGIDEPSISIDDCRPSAEISKFAGPSREAEHPTPDSSTPNEQPTITVNSMQEFAGQPSLPPSLPDHSEGVNKDSSQVEFSDTDIVTTSTPEHPPAIASVANSSEPQSRSSDSMQPTPSEKAPLQVNLCGSEELNQESSEGEESFSILEDLIQEHPSPQNEANVADEEIASGEHPNATSPAPMLQKSTGHLAPIYTSQSRGGSIDSPASVSFGPSPITPDQAFSHAPETIVESEPDESKSVHETILERRAKQASGSPKRLAFVSLSSPTKELRDSLFSASLEKTVRPAPSPLYEDSQHSPSDSVTSSAAMSSPRPSWAELQRRAGVSQKVPFGFRQSLLVGQEESSSLASKLASHFSRDSAASRTSSTSSLSPTAVFHGRRPASRVDILAGRPRSVSPAPFASGPSSYRHSIASHTNSVHSLQIRSSASLPASASQAEFFSDRLGTDSPPQGGDPGPSTDRRASWMRPLRLSQVYSSTSSHSRNSSALSNDKRLSTISNLSSQAHVRNASQESIVENTQRSSSRSSLISAYLDDSHIPSRDSHTILVNGGSRMPSLASVLASAELTTNPSEGEETFHRHSESTGTVGHESGSDLLSPLSGSMRGLNFEELSHFQWPESDHEIGSGKMISTEEIPPDQTIPAASYQNTLIPPDSTRPTNVSMPTPCHAIATPRPTLMFAIASDNPAEVERVLASGEARPNDVIGPQSALEFALTNDALVNKTEIVKTLLAFGADPSALPDDLRNAHTQEVNGVEEEDDVLADLPSEGGGASISKRKKRESVLNPAMKYYLNRASAGTSAVLRRSDFRPLARMRFDFVGQDRALEHLYWVLGMHSQQPIGTPLVVLCCGPCGHGKSLLARKFGSLLDVPTHTVNMTVLKTSHDLWQCPSMSPYDPPSDRTLAEFLEANAGKRCVVVLDEIDKNEDERTLWSLLAPWELGRCSIDAERRHIDVRNVIWLGTSNLGQDLVFEHHAARTEPDTVMSKAEYRELMNTLRPRVTERLGTSLMSRVTAVLPFVPFTPEEKLAIASEAILALGGETASELGPEDFESLASQCVSEYVETDGARSLYRSVSTHLMDAF